MSQINAPDGGYRLGAYHEYPLPESLRSVAEVAWSYRAPVSAGRAMPAHRVIPETGISLCVTSYRVHRGTSHDPVILVMGPIRTTRRFVPVAGQVMEGIRLKPECARWLLGIDPAEFADVYDIAPSAVTRRVPRLRDQVARSTKPDEAVRAICGALTQQAHRRPTSHSSMTLGHVLDSLRARPVSGMRASAHDLSERHLRRLVREATGAGIRTFVRVRRLLHAVSLADGTATPGWSRIAADAGYCDQSHLTNEFRLLTGLTPVQLHAERSGQWLANEGASALAG